MNINKLFSTEERLKILGKIIFKDISMNVNRTAKELKLSKGLVSKYFNLLVSEKILKRNKNQFTVLGNSSVRSIKILLNINQFKPILFKKYPFIEGVGLYGSCVKGTNKGDSDIDLWIRVKNSSDIKLAKLTNELKRKNDKINPLFLTNDKLKKLKEKDTIFYNSLYFGSIVIYGDEIEI